MSTHEPGGTVISQDALRAQFLDWLSDWSEANWCAGWHSGIEQMAREAGGLWVAVAAACGGWPKGYRAEDGWEPLTAEELASLPQLGRDVQSQETNRG